MNRLIATSAALLLTAATLSLPAAGGEADGAIVGIWEGTKVDGRFQRTEPWGPFEIVRDADGSLAATYLGSRLGDQDRAMYDVSLRGERFQLKMSRYGGAVLTAKFRPEIGIVGTLRHHGMTEELRLERIPKRSDRDILALLESGRIADEPPYQSEFISVLIHHGVEAARKIYDAVRARHPDRPIWGPGAVNDWGYQLLNENRTAEAIEVFELNVAAYPDDANSYDSLGEGYLRHGDRELAIAAFRKSLTLNPRPEVRQNSLDLLEKLGAGP